MRPDRLRVLIVAEHASLRFGGEAALPLHYFRVLRRRGVDASLVVHARTRPELEAQFAADLDRIQFVPDTAWHRALWHAGKPFPHAVSYVTTGFAMRLLTQLRQRAIAQRVVRERDIDVIHQPIPVSPREPSTLFGMGVPVVIGPMNGGMSYPPAFRRRESPIVAATTRLGRLSSRALNVAIPGKRRADTLLVANARTRAALADVAPRGEIVELVDNAVDLSLWRDGPERGRERPPGEPARFVFAGRLVALKGVDLLLEAFRKVVEHAPATLEIVGDGPERLRLERQARGLGLLGGAEQARVLFSGWLAQRECVDRLRAADALVLPSLHECGGAVVLEAMAMGLAVVATNWGGPADYVDGSCGILVDPDSREAFVGGLGNAMLRLARDPALARRLGAAGRQRVVERFDWDAKADAILEVYERAVLRARAARA